MFLKVQKVTQWKYLEFTKSTKTKTSLHFAERFGDIYKLCHDSDTTKLLDQIIAAFDEVRQFLTVQQVLRELR